LAAHSALTLALTVLAVWVALPHLIAIADPAQTLGRPRGYLPGGALLAFYAWLVAGVIVHEGAHAVCANGFGFPVTQIRLGCGRVIARRTVRRTLLSLHAMPFGGCTVWDPGTRGVLPSQRAAIAGAGPLANLALGVLLLGLRSHAPDLTVSGAFANLVLFVGNAVPRPPSQNAPVANDGWQILKNVTKSPWALNQARRQQLQAGVAALRGAERTPDIASYLRSAIDASGGDYPDAEALLTTFLLSPSSTKAQIAEGFARSERLLCDARAHPMWRACALNNRAYLIAVGGWPHLMPEAEALAREALRWRPNDSSFYGTLALVLVRFGRDAEAEALLSRVIQNRLDAMGTGPALQHHNRSLASNRCTLALLHFRAGSVDAARAELSAARSLDPHCVLLAELDRLLSAQSRSGVPVTEHGRELRGREDRQVVA
jgi:tetratricopeptide (TPR) repeat protein